MSEYVKLGTVTLVGGYPLEVIAGPDRTAILREPESGYSFTLSDLGVGELAGLLDRLAMPGQTHVRPCCDHCNNGEGDPAGHDYIPGGSAHDGPCEQCAAERARREHDEETG